MKKGFKFTPYPSEKFDIDSNPLGEFPEMTSLKDAESFAENWLKYHGRDYDGINLKRINGRKLYKVTSKKTVESMRDMSRGTLLSVDSVPSDERLQFVSDSQDVDFLRNFYPIAWNFDSFYVEISDGDYTQVWGMMGIIPALDKTLTKVV